MQVNRPFHVEDLTALPTPDFTGLPLDRYLAPAAVLPYNLGKGCYWNNCLFCEIPLINNLPGTHYRVKSARLIVDPWRSSLSDSTRLISSLPMNPARRGCLRK